MLDTLDATRQPLPACDGEGVARTNNRNASTQMNMSKHLHTLRAITLCITALLGTAHSSRCQTPNVICDVTEFCYCFDGVGTPVGQNPPTMSFTLCSDSIGSNLTVLFCSGQTPPGGVIRGYDGLDNTGTPISSLTGGFLNLQGVIGTANTRVPYRSPSISIPHLRVVLQATMRRSDSSFYPLVFFLIRCLATARVVGRIAAVRG